jgi:hypothetical protein
MPWIVAQTIVRQLNAAREHVNLIGPLANEASETLDGIGGPDRAMQCLRKVVKAHGLVFLLGQAPDGLWREFALLGECSQQAGSRLPPWWAGPTCRESDAFDVGVSFFSR